MGLFLTRQWGTWMQTGNEAGKVCSAWNPAASDGFLGAGRWPAVLSIAAL